MALKIVGSVSRRIILLENRMLSRNRTVFQVERYLRINLLGPGPHLIKKKIYRAAVSQKLRNAALRYLSESQLSLTEAHEQFCAVSWRSHLASRATNFLLDVSNLQTVSFSFLSVIICRLMLVSCDTFAN